jgi:type III secretory pathway component EscT
LANVFLRLIVGMVAGFYAVFAFWGLNAGGQVGDGTVFERLIAKSEHQMGFID